MKAGQQIICIITQSHLCNNPRVLKEAITLARTGYRVVVLNSIFSNSYLQQDLSAVQGHDIELLTIADSSNKNFQSFTDRFINRCGRLLVKFFSVDNYFALGFGAGRYLKKSIALNADLYICHQELATWIGIGLIKRGAKVAFDFEDWYSEDLLPAARAARPVALLRSMESEALEKGVCSITTSAALAKKLAETYNCRLPAVIYNVFPSNNALTAEIKVFEAPLKLLWFSQTIGPGRGIEEFLYILKSVNTQLEVTLLGYVSDNYKYDLSRLMPKQHILKFHRAVEQQQLPAKIAEFDIGLALESTTPMSRNYTITNKFFQYLQSGLPIICSETEGQNEGFEKYKPGIKLSQTPDTSEIEAFENWLNNPAALQAARNSAVAAAKFYNWENESKKLIQLIEKVFENAG